MINLFLLIVAAVITVLLFQTGWQNQDADRKAIRQMKRHRVAGRQKAGRGVCTNAYGEVYFVVEKSNEVSPLLGSKPVHQIYDRRHAVQPLLMTHRMDFAPTIGTDMDIKKKETVA